ncbi:hypothetical protein C2142_10640 [Streptomyces sp. CB01881]|nr:hypothetical protein C2142_10640 [Streptomyces sp. CB01881]
MAGDYSWDVGGHLGGAQGRGSGRGASSVDRQTARGGAARPLVPGENSHDGKSTGPREEARRMTGPAAAQGAGP